MPLSTPPVTSTPDQGVFVSRPRLAPEAPVPSPWSQVRSALARPRRAPSLSGFLVTTWAWLASALVVLVRWLEIAFMWVGVEEFPETIGSALLGGVLLPSITLGVASMVWAVLRAGGHHPGAAISGALLAAFSFGGLISFLQPYSFVDAWDIETASAVAPDLLFVLSAALCALIALTVTKGFVRVLVGAFCIVVGTGLLVVLTVSLTFVAGLRNPIDPAVLWHTLMTLRELSTIVASEANGRTWALLFVCIALCAGALWALGARAAKRQRLRDEPIGVTGALWTVLPLLLVIGALPSPPVTLGYGVLTRVNMALRAPEMKIDASLAAAHRFDTRQARFIPVDTTASKNVIVVVLESHRRLSTTPYTPELDTTPYLNALSRQGRLVNEMYSVVPHTNKSLVSIFGGVYPRLTPDFASNKPGGLPARGLPSLLAEHGFSTAFFTPATMEFENKGQILDNLGFEKRFGDGDFSTVEAETENYFGHEDYTVLDSAHAWIDSQVRAKRPFFLGLLTLSSHHPYVIPESFPSKEYSTDEELNAYYNALRYTDSFLQDLWEGVKARGLAESTLLVVIGDHGEAFGEHGAVTHSDVIWDEALAIPALVVGPDIEPGRARGLRSVVDVLPTVADALGYRIEGADGLPGRSLLQSVPNDRTIYHARRSVSAAISIRTGSRKMIAWSQRPAQLFDVHADPGEHIDLAGEGAPFEIQEEVRSAWVEALAWKDGVTASYAAIGQ